MSHADENSREDDDAAEHGESIYDLDRGEFYPVGVEAIWPEFSPADLYIRP